MVTTSFLNEDTRGERRCVEKSRERGKMMRSYEANEQFDDSCSYSTSTTAVNLTDDEEECATFLLTLKYRSCPNLEDDLEKMKRSPLGRHLFLYKENEADETEKVKEDEMELCMSMDSNKRPRLDEASWHSEDIVEEDLTTSQCLTDPAYFAGLSVPLGLPDDSYWLSDVQCYVRANCAEVFAATEADASPSSKKRSGGRGGRRPRVTTGRVGIRCVYCRNLPPSRRAPQAVSYPSLISGIYSAVVMMQCRHFSTCHMIPDSVKTRISELKDKTTRWSSGGGNNQGRQQYWIDSAKKLGLADTEQGIRFSKRPVTNYQDFMLCDEGQLPAQTVSSDSIQAHQHDIPMDSSHEKNQDDKTKSSLIAPTFSAIQHMVGEATLVVPEDLMLIPDYLFIAMAQMRPCKLAEVDRVGCYKSRQLGFPGMCCKHCGGQPGFGKYFPATVRSLAQTTTSQTIIKHVGSKCRHCPEELRTQIVSLQAASLAKGGCYGRGGNAKETVGKPKYGSRKVFFQRLWGRIHGQEVPGIPDSALINEEDESHKSDEEVSSLDDDASSVSDSSVTDAGIETPSMISHEDIDEVEDSDNDDMGSAYTYTNSARRRNKTNRKRKTSF